MAFLTSNYTNENQAVATSGSFVNDRDSNVSIGLNMPLQNESFTGYFGTTKTTLMAVKENIRMLLQTELGERMMQPRLGVNIRRYLFEQFTEETSMDLKSHVIEAFSFWLPFVDITEFNVDMAADEGWQGGVGKNALTISITFNINKDPNSSESLQVNIEQ